MTVLALTPGDPTGIGPEITVKALQRLGNFPGLKLSIVGSVSALEYAAKQLGLPLPKNSNVAYMDIEDEAPGAVAYQSLETAVKLIKIGEAAALVTGPISKRNLKSAGITFPGHTEILEHFARALFEAPDAAAEMLFIYNKFRLMLLTRHIALKDVPAALAQSGAVSRPLKTLISFLRHRLKISDPNIALLGVNPHAGEIGGGEEESRFYLPVIKAVNAIGASTLAGPFAADGFFRGFNPDKPGYDAIVAAYHDQGLIPFKILAGFDAVNVTIGLPFLRTSVSHGTADDIAGKGKASEASLLAALHVALESV